MEIHVKNPRIINPSANSVEACFGFRMIGKSFVIKLFNVAMKLNEWRTRKVHRSAFIAQVDHENFNSFKL